MHEVAFDETGNTGAALLSLDQPVFALASISLSRSEADEILASIRTAQTGEIKFKHLRRKASGQRRILKLISSPELTSGNVIATLVHKRFMVVSKVVDLLVESFAHANGVDLYKGDATIAISNLHFYSMTNFCGEDWPETFLHRFVDMLRERTYKNVRRFYDAARVLCEISNDKDYAKLLIPILASEQIIGHILANSNRNSLDPAIPAFVQHCTLWGERFGEDFEIVHDSSKPIFEEKTMLENLMGRGEEEHLIGCP